MYAALRHYRGACATTENHENHLILIPLTHTATVAVQLRQPSNQQRARHTLYPHVLVFLLRIFPTPLDVYHLHHDRHRAALHSLQTHFIIPWEIAAAVALPSLLRPHCPYNPYPCKQRQHGRPPSASPHCPTTTNGGSPPRCEECFLTSSGMHPDAMSMSFAIVGSILRSFSILVVGKVRMDCYMRLSQVKLTRLPR